MKRITNTISCIIIAANCLLVLALHSCSSNNTDNYTRCEDSLAMYKAAGKTDTAIASGNMNNADSVAYESKAAEGSRTINEKAGKNDVANATEPGGPGTLVVTSSAFANNGVIPVKYTCDGAGVTPPIKVTNIPEGAKSLTLIVHDYNATPEGGRTFWIIWNLDTYGNIPENFHSDYEGMNAAKQYGNTPICAKSGNHKYHFIVYAVDCRLVIGKNTTKQSIEKVMKGHVLAKGELVGVYNKLLE